MTDDDQRTLPALDDVEETVYVAPPQPPCKTCHTTTCGGAWYVGEPCVWRCGLR